MTSRLRKLDALTLATLVLCGCEPGLQPKREAPAERPEWFHVERISNRIYRYRDDQTNVTCYLFQVGTAINDVIVGCAAEAPCKTD